MLIVPDKVVGEWDFSLSGQPSCRDSRECVQPMLAMAQVAAQVLEEHDLLRIEEINFSRWLKRDPQTNRMVAASEEAPYKVKIEGGLAAPQTMGYCNQLLDYLEKERPFLFPVEIEFSGTGLVLQPEGNSVRWPYVTNFYVYEFADYMLNFTTRCDAWLPFSLKARPQPQIHALNAPRLEQALNQIQERLSAKVQSEDHTEYARIRGFQLENHLDEATGEPEIADFTDEDDLPYQAPEQ